MPTQLQPYWQTTDERTVRLYHGSALTVLRRLPSRSVQCIVTSPPYWGLRDYDAGPEELGQEYTPQEYVSRLVDIFDECKRVLRADGTLWLNIGDTFGPKRKHKQRGLVGIPHRVRFAMEDAGWITAMEHIWHKPDPMPGDVGRRCTLAHEYVYLFTNSAKYYYDSIGMNGPEAISNRRSVWSLACGNGYKGAHYSVFPQRLIEPCVKAGISEYGCCSECGMPYKRRVQKTQLTRPRPHAYVKRTGEEGTGNVCDNRVAGVSTQTLGWAKDCSCLTTSIQPCVVMDPFIGSGTTAIVSTKCLASCWGIELNESYLTDHCIPRIKEELQSSSSYLLD